MRRAVPGEPLRPWVVPARLSVRWLRVAGSLDRPYRSRLTTTLALAAAKSGYLATSAFDPNRTMISPVGAVVPPEAAPGMI